MNESSPPPASNERPNEAAASEPESALRAIRSQELLRGAQEVLIQHGTDVYRLRLTRNGKLILHK